MAAHMKDPDFALRALEQEVAESRPGLSVLDIGCGRGDNLKRLARYGGRPFGMDPSLPRLRHARRISHAVAARGEALPCADGSFEMVYISHVLHHARDLEAVLRESYRALAPGGMIFVTETVDDSPLIRIAHALRPRWDNDEVLTRFRYLDLRKAMEEAGFTILEGSKFNWMYFAWALLPSLFRPLERLSPFFRHIEAAFSRS